MIKQLAKYLTTGVVNTVLGASVIFGLMFMGVHYVIANFTGYGVGLLSSFILNRQWTFDVGNDDWRNDTLPFVLLFIVAYTANISLVTLMAEGFSIDEYLSQVIGIVVYNALNFFGMKFFVFKNSETLQQ